ncbi:MAG TPA: hypothetical protein HPP77_11010 [Candidatus Hydrogenedentes bacterium]|nr:hypothetical protein [Candidatus Hydrogenedentota bacterium]HIJ73517.1 hypothetical protein [Candidatus Hydrogenedentota bacterium]
MGSPSVVEQKGARLGRRLVGLYFRCFALFMMAMIALWIVGVEGIYRHPTPFYALFAPVFDSLLVPATVLALCWMAYLAFRRSPFCGDIAAPRRFQAAAILCALLTLAIAAGLVRRDGPASARLAAYWLAVRWHLPAVVVLLGGLGVLSIALSRLKWFDQEPSPAMTRRILLGAMLFAVLFAGAVAMIRGGPKGITQAYERRKYEYIGDIGKGGSIRGLFRDYEDLHPTLSLHGKAHPPGAIAILWVLSYALGEGILTASGVLMALGAAAVAAVYVGAKNRGDPAGDPARAARRCALFPAGALGLLWILFCSSGQEALGLSIATMFFGTLGMLPLFLWANDLGGRRMAVTCCTLYALIPSVVLFTATSGDVLFVPFSITTLLLFWRALHRRSLLYAVAAGVFFGLCSLISFTQLSLGAFFAFVGLLRLKDRATRVAVVQTAAVMILSFLGLHLLVWYWSSFDVFACFRLCKSQFYLDQFHLDQVEPRYPAWVFRFLNPFAWFYFAGIPVSVLLIWRLARPEKATKGLFVCFALTLLAMNLLYLGRGEGERSALYVYPFMVIPAAHLLAKLHRETRSHSPLFSSLAFMAFQCWFTESYFYTYW